MILMYIRDMPRGSGGTRRTRPPNSWVQTVYGLAELHRKEIAKSSLVGNPRLFCGELYPRAVPGYEI